MKLVLYLALFYICYFLTIGVGPVESKRRKCYYVDRNNNKLRPVSKITELHVTEKKIDKIPEIQNQKLEEHEEENLEPKKPNELIIPNDDDGLIQIVLPDPPSFDSFNSDEEIQSEPVQDTKSENILEQQVLEAMTEQQITPEASKQQEFNPNPAQVAQQFPMTEQPIQPITLRIPVQYFPRPNLVKPVDSPNPFAIFEQQIPSGVPGQHSPIFHPNPINAVVGPNPATMPDPQRPLVMPWQNLPHSSAIQAVNDPQSPRMPEQHIQSTEPEQQIPNIVHEQYLPKPSNIQAVEGPKPAVIPEQPIHPAKPEQQMPSGLPGPYYPRPYKVQAVLSPYPPAMQGQQISSANNQKQAQNRYSQWTNLQQSDYPDPVSFADRVRMY